MAYQLQEKDLKTETQWQKYYKELYLKDWTPACKSGESENWSGKTGKSGEINEDIVATLTLWIHRDQEWGDTEIDQKLLGKLLLEMAWFLITGDENAFRNSNEWEKSSMDKWKHDSERKECS